MAAAATTITAKQAITAASAAVSALGSIRQGRDAKAAADFDAAQLEQQAKRDEEIAKLDAQDFRNSEARRQATLRARVAGSGTTLEGSSLAVLSNLAEEAEFQALRIESGGDTAQAFNQAELRRAEGRSARTAGFTRAGATLLTGASKFG